MSTPLKEYNVSTEKDREELIISYMAYVNSIAKTVSRQFHCSEFDDLCSCGYRGLLEAVEKFDPTKNVTFKYYAYIRIYGHMLDFMRKLYAGSNATVTLKKKIKAFSESRAALGLDTHTEDCIKEFEMTMEEFQAARNKINNTFVLNFSDMSGTSHGVNPMLGFDATQHFVAETTIAEDDLILVDQLWKAMKDKFTPREYKIMELIYLQDMTYPEISLQVGISDRRISQIHLDALSRLKKLAKHGRHTKPKETRKSRVGV